MAIFHAHLKVLSRSNRNTVRALAYRSGTRLMDERTGQLFDYREKEVPYVELMLPEDAPEWAEKLKELISRDRNKGVQCFSSLAEKAEKRIDAQVYKEFEFALPNELTLEQNIELARSFIEHHICKLGITVLANFHHDYEGGTSKPHCHAVLLTRELTEEGLSKYKNTDWNKKEHLETWREQLAGEINHHLSLHGHHSRVDHRSHEEQEIDIEAQPKLSRGIREYERRSGVNPKHVNTSVYTDKAKQYQEITLRNMYRIMKRPELVFDIIHGSQSTFMWGDVERVLARYFDDASVFRALSAQLRGSAQLRLLKETEEGNVYTTQKMLVVEARFVTLATALEKTKGFGVKRESIERHLSLYDVKYAENGGLSSDQKAAISHMVGESQVCALVGYAGTGKTSSLQCAQDIWKDNGYQVYGLAPTGKAAQNLEQAGISSLTVHKFLREFKAGRYQFNRSTVLVLDEAGMVDVKRFESLLSAVNKLGVKLVATGDRHQLQPIEAGPAFRLLSQEVQLSTLSTVIRQKEDWMRRATQSFGQAKTQEALELYQRKGHLHLIEEPLPDIGELVDRQDYKGLVNAFNLSVRSQRLVGWTFRTASLTQEDRAQGNALKEGWRSCESIAGQAIEKHLEDCLPFIKEMDTDPYRLGENFRGSREALEKLLDATKQERGWGANKERNWALKCDLRSAAMEKLLEDWHISINQCPEKTHLIMAYTLQDTETLNHKARSLLKQEGKIDSKEYIHTIKRIDENDFGDEIITIKERAFSKGDQILFMRNDNGLGVKNGMLGTIEEIDQNKLKVHLEGDKRISFASNLYPYFDLGLAINVYKSQGTTIDKGYLLATNHLTSNLSYVGMTRHKEDVQVYGSGVEFWNKSIIIAQLSRSEEKLSSLDYLEEEQVLKLVKQDQSILKEAFLKVSNHLKAAHYIVRRSIAPLWGKEYPFERIEALESLTETQRYSLHLGGEFPKLWQEHRNVSREGIIVSDERHQREGQGVSEGSFRGKEQGLKETISGEKHPTIFSRQGEKAGFSSDLSKLKTSQDAAIPSLLGEEDIQAKGLIPTQGINRILPRTEEELACWAKEFEANNPERFAQYKKELEEEYQEWIKHRTGAEESPKEVLEGGKERVSSTEEHFNRAHDKLQAMENRMLLKRKAGELMTFAEGDELRAQQKVFHQAFVEYAKDSPHEAVEKARTILKAYNEGKIDHNLGKGRKQTADYVLKEEKLARWSEEFKTNNPEKVAQYERELEEKYQEWVKHQTGMETRIEKIPLFEEVRHLAFKLKLERGTDRQEVLEQKIRALVPKLTPQDLARVRGDKDIMANLKRVAPDLFPQRYRGLER